MKLTEKVKIVKAVAPTVGSAGTMTSTEVNATGFNRVLFNIEVGAMTNTATLDAYVQAATTTGGSFANTSSAALTQVADTGGGKVYLIDMPVDKSKAFLKLVIVTTTAAAVNGATAILYDAMNEPVTQTAGQTVVL